MQPNLNEMFWFDAVACAGGFTAAGKQLNIPKSTLSKRIAALEARLGVRLLERSTRTVRLTQAGGRYAALCARVLETARQAEREMREEVSAPRGLLRVAAEVLFGSLFLPEVICEFLRQYPEVSLDLILRDRPVDLIKEEFDLSISTDPYEPGHLVARRLGATYSRFYASPQYLLKRLPPQKPSELQDHQVIYFSPDGRVVDWFLERGAARVKLEMEARLRVTSFFIVKTAALSGLGLATLPPFLVQKEVESGALLPVLPEWCLPWGELRVLYPSAYWLSPQARVFVELLLKTFAHEKPWKNAVR
jgi:DNA-binding transcriptional LysR family regulator